MGIKVSLIDCIYPNVALLLRPKSILDRHIYANDSTDITLTCWLSNSPFYCLNSHTALVGSLCRLLHNFLAGEVQVELSRKEMEVLLTLVGDILDTPSRSSALISVSIALLGRFMPLCTADLASYFTYVF